MKTIKINPADNVAVAIEPLKAGETLTVEGQQVTTTGDVPAGHKILLYDLRAGENVVKYGYPIGHLKEDHQAGDFICDANIKTNLAGLLDYQYEPVPAAALTNPAYAEWFPKEQLTFKGYRRKNGDVGIRNEVWIVPTVGCVNGIVNQLKNQLEREVGVGPDKLRIVAYPHNYGCSQLSEDHENTRLILRDLVLHPNAGAVLVVGLGCENNQPDKFEELLGDYDHERIRFMVAQKVQGDEVEEGMRILRELYALASKDERTDVPLSELRVGLKCGGSDGFSGITANPLLGVFSDFIVSQGGTTVLTEVPEMFGAETILMNRCKTPELFGQTVKLVNDFKQYFLSHGEPVGENPSPGNKAGGISTLEEKALGCTQKCGKSAVCGVLPYGERLRVKGLNLLSAPGNDLVASTALASSGCHIVLFTTGRGTPFGTFVPTMKVSTNSTLAQNKPTWIDFNAGTIVEGEPMRDVFHRFMQKVIAVANGEPTWNEKKNYQEIAIFKTGVTL
ncbi:MAG: altronate dehydratase [Bacteroidaceae bacterium]|nr:altronate dehydratase [Bacteroidaceae bacterium]MBQ9642277.1 altronate dehydratase [Bacteroidaceae bacterium]